MAMDEAEHLDMRRVNDCEVAAGIPRPSNVVFDRYYPFFVRGEK